MGLVSKQFCPSLLEGLSGKVDQHPNLFTKDSRHGLLKHIPGSDCILELDNDDHGLNQLQKITLFKECYNFRFGFLISFNS